MQKTQVDNYPSLIYHLAQNFPSLVPIATIGFMAAGILLAFWWLDAKGKLPKEVKEELPPKPRTDLYSQKLGVIEKELVAMTKEVANVKEKIHEMELDRTEKFTRISTELEHIKQTMETLHDFVVRSNSEKGN